MTVIRSNKRPQVRPRAVILSKRANIFYLEHARVLQKDDRIIYLTEDGEEVERYFNIPEKNTALVLLGKGTSITDAAMRRLAESNVMVGFCGSGGSPLFGAIDCVFLSPQSEYRPTEYMQSWMRIWIDEERRIAAAKTLLASRAKYTAAAWAVNIELLKRGVSISEEEVAQFVRGLQSLDSHQALLLYEAKWAKELYAKLARAFEISFTRKEGERKSETVSDVVNGFLDHGNYIAYGFAAVALFGLGISFAFPLLHGKTRRGALVFDIADHHKRCARYASCFFNGFKF